MSDKATTRAAMAPEASSHYDAKYFAWQQEMGRLGGWANVDKFCRTVGTSDRVLDFGCGGGFLLANLECRERFGIEPNPAARESASSKGVKVFANGAEALSALGAASIDVIISDNAAIGRKRVSHD
jgi:SAM-dependent methyltransferase